MLRAVTVNEIIHFNDLVINDYDSMMIEFLPIVKSSVGQKSNLVLVKLYEFVEYSTDETIDFRSVLQHRYMVVITKLAK